MDAHLQALLATFDPNLPVERARTIPSSWYRDGQLYERERQTAFAGSWLGVGRAEQIAGPGSFLTAEIAGEPILVVRDLEGILRAFYKVCRHRAAPVVTEPCGQATRLRCRYHGWTYDLAGRLRGVPEFDGVADFCRESEGLVELRAEVWGPLVWIHPGPQPPPLAEWLAPMPEWLRDCSWSRLRFVERRAYEVVCNWKVYIDNYLDGGYHINTIHPGLGSVLDYSQYRTDIGPFASVQHSPLCTPTSAEGNAVATVRQGDRAQYWWVFPNMMLNLYQEVMDTNLVLPLGPERCRVVFDFYVSDNVNKEPFVRDSIEMGHRIQLEDVGICEEVQRGLGSRSFDTGRYSVRREMPVYHFHQLLARRLRGDL